MRSIMLALLLLLNASAWADEPLFNAEGYRQTLYRSPTPASVEGAQTLDTPALQALLKQQPRTALIDVYRRQWLHERFIAEESHHNLPGSLWLANTGDGVLDERFSRYFTQQLQRLSGGHKDWPLVFYCRSDCWLSWNATRRARTLGYTQLYWYRDGVDAWQQAGLPLQEAEPAALD